MPYSKKIESLYPGLFIFLLDQSKSMEQPLAGSPNRMADELALAVNKLLYELVIKATGAAGVKRHYDFAVIGYSTDGDGNATIGPALIGPLAGKEIVSVTEIAANPARIEKVTEINVDIETGEMLEQTIEMPIWVDPVVLWGTPICGAIVKACEIIDQWTPQHMKSFPPIVINITDGEPTDGDPIPYADVLKQRCTDDGNVLFFNCCLSPVPADKFVFRGNAELMPSVLARTLFDMSSVLPQEMVQFAKNKGFDVEPNARCMAFNADMVVLTKFLNTGTDLSELK